MTGEGWRGRALVAGAVVVAAVALVVHVAPWLDEGFGVSHDGYNGAMWGISARAARDDLLGSRLGGIRPNGTHYAHHPPLMMWTATASSAVGGERPLALRAPGLLASLAALVLLVRLLRDAGLRAAATAAGVVVGGTTATFLTYGAMLDTPVFALPFGLGALAAAQRAWQGRPVPPALAAAAGALAALAGWQATLAALLGGALVAARPNTRRSAGPLLAGLGAGLLVTFGWIAWVDGTLLEIADQASVRTSSGADWVGRQRRFLGDLFGWPTLGLAAIGLVAAAGRRLRPDRDAGAWRGPLPLAGALGVTVVAYTLGLRQASAVHDYWTYWGAALVAVGVGILAERALAAADGRRPPVRAATGAVVAVVALALAGTGAARRSDADRALRAGLDAVPVLAAAPRAGRPDEATIAVRNAARTGAPWADYATRGRVLRPTPAELASLPGDTLLFVQAAGAPSPELRAAAVAAEGPFVLVRLDDYRRLVG